jgi:hypothetical protein
MKNIKTDSDMVRFFADELSDMAKHWRRKNSHLSELIERQVMELHKLGSVVREVEDVRETGKDS